MTPAAMRAYGELCGWTLARAHARSRGPDRYRCLPRPLRRLWEVIADFAAAYAGQNERDYQSLALAASGRITAEHGV